MGKHRVESPLPASPKLFSTVFLREHREAFWRLFERLLEKRPEKAIELFRELADRSEGRPKQAIEVTAKRGTVFKAPVPPALPPPDEESLDRA